MNTQKCLLFHEKKYLYQVVKNVKFMYITCINFHITIYKLSAEDAVL